MNTVCRRPPSALSIVMLAISMIIFSHFCSVLGKKDHHHNDVFEPLCNGKHLKVLGVESIVANNTVRLYMKTHYYQFEEESFENITGPFITLPYNMKYYDSRNEVFHFQSTAYVCFFKNATCKVYEKDNDSKASKNLNIKSTVVKLGDIKGFVSLSLKDSQNESLTSVGIAFDTKNMYVLEVDTNSSELTVKHMDQRTEKLEFGPRIQHIVTIADSYFIYNDNVFCQLDSIFEGNCKQNNTNQTNLFDCPYLDKKIDPNHGNGTLAHDKKKAVFVGLAVVLLLLIMIVLAFAVINSGNDSRSTMRSNMNTSKPTDNQAPSPPSQQAVPPQQTESNAAPSLAAQSNPLKQSQSNN